MLFVKYFIKQPEDELSTACYLNADKIEAIRVYDCTPVLGCPDGYQVACWISGDGDLFCLSNLLPDSEDSSKAEVAMVEIIEALTHTYPHFTADVYQQ